MVEGCWGEGCWTGLLFKRLVFSVFFLRRKSIGRIWGVTIERQLLHFADVLVGPKPSRHFTCTEQTLCYRARRQSNFREIHVSCYLRGKRFRDFVLVRRWKLACNAILLCARNNLFVILGLWRKCGFCMQKNSPVLLARFILLCARHCSETHPSFRTCAAVARPTFPFCWLNLLAGLR